jgi:hypothetical protein
MRDLGDVCGARNTQFEQEFFGLFLGETVSAYNWRDRIGDFCVADYLEEFDTVHVRRYPTRFSLHLRRKGSGASTCCFEKRRRRARRSSSCAGRQRQTVHCDIVRQQYHFSPSGATESNWKTWLLSRSRSSQTKAAVTHTPPLRSCASRAMVNS